VAVRLLPVAPFTVVNLVCGASQIRFRDFAVGSAIVIGPGTGAVVLFADRVVAVATHPDPGTIGIAVSFGLALVIGVAWLGRVLGRTPAHERGGRHRG
ncbi:MAG: VTT domain-containing protein, partial [Planctomycetes bacterium]|nr:VTT domain-containing protein [Planctomycetota bacterium]